MLRRTKLFTSLMLAFGGASALTSAFAQQQLERVEITGSAIKRIDAETAVPVTVLRVDDLKKEGITTIEQVIARISANQSQQGTSQAVGLGTGGASFANLRGLGQNKTLVLLNGRRLANNAIDASAPDLNTIPFAALERVEVLRDGASALYGTDAVGGVINFITRRAFQGASATLGYDQPTKQGGKAYNGSFTFGVGDYDKDLFNLLGVIEYQKQDRIRASERPYVDLSQKTSGSTFPGQYNQGGRVQHPLYPDCGAPAGIPTSTLASGNHSCGYLYAREVDLIPNTDRTSIILKATGKVNSDTRASLEYFATESRNDTLIAGVPYGNLYLNPGTPFYPGNGITPLPTSFTLNPAYLPGSAPLGARPGVIRLRWRDEVSGGRAEQTVNTQQRLVAALDGSAIGWDYKAGVAYNSNSLRDRLTGGYTDGTIVTPGVLNGQINPFGPQTPAGANLLTSAAAKGTLFTAKGTVYSADAQASRELGDWFKAGRPAALAIGTEFRHERFLEVGNPDFDALVISSTGFDPATDNRGQRNVAAVYTELNVPILKELEVTGSLRFDHYSDFGSTTNPKVSFRYQPIQQALFRGSFSTGFRAPSLYELNAPNTYTNSSNNHNDPVNCPNGTGINGVPTSDACGIQFLVLNGGNKALKPEKARNFSAGMVFEPLKDTSVSVDFWWIALRQQIGVLSDDTIFSNPTQYASLFHRAPDGTLSTDGSLCPGANCGYVTDTSDNLGEVHTSGIDFNANYRLRSSVAGNFIFGLNSTYTRRYDYQDQEGGIFNKNVGIYSGVGPIFKWQTAVNIDWTYATFGAGVVGHYKSGYIDQDPTNNVGSYTVFDVYGTWQPVKTVALTLGLKNALDRRAPFSKQTATFQTGYDPRFADPTGRTVYARGTYSF